MLFRLFDVGTNVFDLIARRTNVFDLIAKSACDIDIIHAAISCYTHSVVDYYGRMLVWIIGAILVAAERLLHMLQCVERIPDFLSSVRGFF